MPQKIVLDDKFKQIFVTDRKCIVNADIDGIIAGMFLQHFLNWKVVGYSSCCGTQNDELWLEDQNENLEECVFVDLPVIISNYSVVDQHFVLFDEESLKQYNNHGNKVNPNVMRKRVFINADGRCEYTSKYPFGTSHFVLAVLENLKLIDEDYLFDFKKRIGSFDLADLLLRADRVIGNTDKYTTNCINWADWMFELGGCNTENLFAIVKNEYKKRVTSETQVEKALLSYGCKGADGDCSNLFKSKDYDKLSKYFNFLSNSFSFKPLPVYQVFDYGKLKGKRATINYGDATAAKSESTKSNIFSYAFVSMRTFSLTYST